MALQISDVVRNARLDAVETAIGTSAILKMFAGTKPANCAAADAGTVVATLALPADYMNAASAGSKTKLGTWADATADAAGTIQYFRIYASNGTTCHMQGTAGLTSSGSDMELDNTNVQAGQSITVTAFTLNEPNA